jgi:hypothetical protein
MQGQEASVNIEIRNADLRGEAGEKVAEQAERVIRNQIAFLAENPGSDTFAGTLPMSQ